MPRVWLRPPPHAPRQGPFPGLRPRRRSEHLSIAGSAGWAGPRTWRGRGWGKPATRGARRGQRRGRVTIRNSAARFDVRGHMRRAAQVSVSGAAWLGFALRRCSQRPGVSGALSPRLPVDRPTAQPRTQPPTPRLPTPLAAGVDAVDSARAASAAEATQRALLPILTHRPACPGPSPPGHAGGSHSTPSPRGASGCHSRLPPSPGSSAPAPLRWPEDQ